jgi:hypothetical protein
VNARGELSLDRPGVIGALALISAIPLLWPTIPPLTDLPGHMGRYAVQLGLAGGDWFSFKWALVGNLGVDLLVQLIGPLIGLELAVKVIMICTVALTALGFLLVARQIHGRVPPTALFALPLIYSFPFHFGFINFALSVALAFLSFALWIRLADRETLRAVLFVPLACVVWTAHIYGWGVLGILAFAFEAKRDRRPLWRAVVACAPLLSPLVLMIISQQSEGIGDTGMWFNFDIKRNAVLAVLADRFYWLDHISVGVLALVILAYVRLSADRGLGLAALLFTALFVIMPGNLIGSAHADIRLLPIMLTTAILSIKPATPRWIAVAALLFFGIRTSATTISYWLYDQSYQRELVALSYIPAHARLVSLVGAHCKTQWARSRLEHLPSIALVRRGAFANDQWNLAGAQLISIQYPQGAPFDRDPSQFVSAGDGCNPHIRPLSVALKMIPRSAFDFIWVINAPADPDVEYRGLTALWQSGRSALYRINR